MSMLGAIHRRSSSRTGSLISAISARELVVLCMTFATFSYELYDRAVWRFLLTTKVRFTLEHPRRLKYDAI